MRGSWIPRTVFSIKPQNGSKNFLKSTFFAIFHEILTFENQNAIIMFILTWLLRCLSIRYWFQTSVGDKVILCKQWDVFMKQNMRFAGWSSRPFNSYSGGLLNAQCSDCSNLNLMRWWILVRGLSQIMFALRVGRWSETWVVCYIKSAN